MPSPHNTLQCLWLSDTRNSLQVSKIAEANFLVFDAAVANLAIGDPMARYALFCLNVSAFGVPANPVRLFSVWRASYRETRPGCRTGRVS